MRRNKKRNKFILLLVLLLVVTIGYAAISTILKLNGTVGINKHTWNVHWENVDNQRGVPPISEATITDDGSENSDAAVNFSVQLNNFGDFYEFTVDAVNEGDVNAKVAIIDLYYNNQIVSDSNPLPSYAKFTITNYDGTEVNMGEVLPKKVGDTPGRKRYTVRLEYSDDNINVGDVNNIDPTETYTFGFRVNYQFTKEEGSSGGDTPIERDLALGDYFTLVPDSDGYTVLSSDTGYSTDAFINPQELTLWRVVKKNSDGTYDAVSEYISNSKVRFKGKQAYANYPDILKNIAAQYAKSGYTVGTRALGYDGQTLRISNIDDFDVLFEEYQENYNHYYTPTKNVGVGEEYQGGIRGDTLYLKDSQMVSQFYRTYEDYGMLAYQYNSSSHEEESICYWIPSRYVYEERASLRYINYNGTLSFSVVYNENGDATDDTTCGIRPIITIKANLRIIDGTGNKSQPYIFE
jgi:hypothetical protein